MGIFDSKEKKEAKERIEVLNKLYKNEEERLGNADKSTLEQIQEAYKVILSILDEMDELNQKFPGIVGDSYKFNLEKESIIDKKSDYEMYIVMDWRNSFMDTKFSWNDKETAKSFLLTSYTEMIKGTETEQLTEKTRKWIDINYKALVEQIERYIDGEIV